VKILVRLSILVLALVVPATARAGEADVRAYVADLAAAPAKADAVAARCRLVVLPAGMLRKLAPAIRVKDLLGDDRSSVELVATKVTRGDIASTGMNEWFDAEVEARAGKKVVARLRLVGLGGAVPPDFDRYEIRLAHWSRPITDKQARKLAPIAVPPIADEIAPAPAPGDDAEYRELLGFVETGGDRVASLLVDGITAHDMVVFGSAPRERYQGKRGAAAIKGWKMKLAATGGAYRTHAGEYCVASQFTGTTTTRPALTIPFVGVLCYRFQISDGGSHVTVPAFASFAVPQ
jgi:hypothetical protein